LDGLIGGENNPDSATALFLNTPAAQFTVASDADIISGPAAAAGDTDIISGRAAVAAAQGLVNINVGSPNGLSQGDIVAGEGVLPQLGINDPPITDPLDNIVSAIGSGINAAISSPFGQRVLGGLEAVGGFAEGVASSTLFAAGGVAEGTVIGVPVGLALQGVALAGLANASDHIVTGTRQAFSGTPQQTVAAQLAGIAATQAGVSPGAVQTIQNAVQFGQGVAGIGTLAGAAQVEASLPQAIVLPSAAGGGGTVTVFRVDDLAFPPRIAPDGSIPVVTTRAGGERALFVNFGQPERAADFALVNRGGNATVTAVDVDASLLERLRASSVLDTGEEAALNPSAPLRVDINKAPDQFGLRTPEQIQALRDAIIPGTVRVINPQTIVK
jgi:hypothetical protein